MDERTALQPPSSSSESSHGSGESASYISCSVCQREIPCSAAVSREASDYTEYFCGLDCYDGWRNQCGRL